MTNITNYIRIMVGSFILDYVKISDEIVYINPAIYAKLKEQIGESTVDTFMHIISGKEYAGYLGITTDRDDWFKWNEKTNTYSRRFNREERTLIFGAG